MSADGTDVGRQAVDTVWRLESARLVSSLARLTGDFALAEDVAQDALAEALVAWPRDGVPREPGAWLLTVGRRRAVDYFRRRTALDARYATIAHELSGHTDLDDGWDPDRIEDDVLTLLFVACHPVLRPDARIALTLRVVGGLTSEEIARAFLVPTATIQARITRAKKSLSAANVRFALPAADERSERLASVRNVIYLIFTEGSTASSGESLIRVDLAYEALRLARVLSTVSAGDAETYGLLALLELTAARFPARTDASGRAVLLEDQDRRRWDRDAIRRGRAALAMARGVGTGLGAYGIQASIAEGHAVAPSVEDTDWGRIVALYDVLTRLAPSPVVALNRAVALAMTEGPLVGLAAVDGLADEPLLRSTHLLPSVRGELLVRLGRAAEAREALEVARQRCANAQERAILEEKLTRLERADRPKR